MKTKITHFIAVALLCLMSVNLSAQDTKLIGGNSLGVILPLADFSESYVVGVSFYGNIDYNLSKHLILRFDLGWSDLSGEEKEYVDTEGNTHTSHPSLTVWEISGGLRLKASIFYLEGRAGYFSGINEFGMVPAVGLRLGKFDLQANYTIAGNKDMFGARISYYWAKND